MSSYLALETATDYGSVAVGEPGAVVAEVLVSDRRHATAIVPAIVQVMNLAGVEYGDLSGIILGDGPGSFTGLRIGFATAAGILSEHDDLDLHVTSSLLATAWRFNFVKPGPVVALYDALRGEVFAAVYRFQQAEVVTELAPRLTTVTQLTELAGVAPTLAVGNGALVNDAVMRRWTGSDPVGPPAAIPRAGALLELLAVEGATKMVDDTSSLEPEYGRLAEAQVRWEKQHGRELKRQI